MRRAAVFARPGGWRRRSSGLRRDCGPELMAPDGLLQFERKSKVEGCSIEEAGPSELFWNCLSFVTCSVKSGLGCPSVLREDGRRNWRFSSARGTKGGPVRSQAARKGQRDLARLRIDSMLAQRLACYQRSLSSPGARTQISP